VAYVPFHALNTACMHPTHASHVAYIQSMSKVQIKLLIITQANKTAE